MAAVQLLQDGAGPDLQEVECAVEIRAPAAVVFTRWTHYEALPEMTGAVRRIRRIDERHLLWDVNVIGRQVVWQAEIVESVAPERVAWHSVGEPQHRGVVELQPVAPDRTRMRLWLEFRPRDGLERIGARLGLVDYQISWDLALFKRFVERRAAATG